MAHFDRIQRKRQQWGEEGGEQIHRPYDYRNCVAICRRLCRAIFSRMLWTWLFTV
jgi:hypothetical protein